MKNGIEWNANLNSTDTSVYDHIEKVRLKFVSMPDFTVTSLGPLSSTDRSPTNTQIVMTGKQLRRASTNSKQGQYLAALADYASNGSCERINIIELGGAAGISAMYLIAGCEKHSGCILYSFEGAPELAKLAELHVGTFLHEKNFNKSELKVQVGNFNQTLEPFIASFKEKLHLAFIDGNHLEKATLQYYQMLRERMSDRGIMVYDDVSWSRGMENAWAQIKKNENASGIIELWQGNRPSRGIVFLGGEHAGVKQVIHIDNLFERLARSFKRQLALFLSSTSKS